LVKKIVIKLYIGDMGR